MAGGGTSTLFGQVLYLQNQSGAIVFIGVLVIFTLFEGVLHVIEVECAKRGFKGLIKKLYREFMIMGFISFAILIATEAYSSPDGVWYNAFHFAHLVLLFIGLTFLVQSATLAALINSRNRTLLAHDNSSSESLIIQYIDLHKRGGVMRFLFEHGPVSIPVPELREKIEYKIIQEFFIRNYNLPREFRFANYMCMVLKNYVLSLVEVRPVNWIILASFVAVNYARIAIIDPVFESDVCSRYPNKRLHRDGFHDRRLDTTNNINNYDASNYEEENDVGLLSTAATAAAAAVGDAYSYYLHSDHHAAVEDEIQLTAGHFEDGINGVVGSFAGGGGGDDKGDDDADYGEHVCTEYMLRYVFVCTMLLVLYLVGVLVATEIYMQRLIDKVLDQEETIEWLEEEEDREVLRNVACKGPAADNGYSVQQFMTSSQQQQAEISTVQLTATTTASAAGAGDAETGNMSTPLTPGALAAAGAAGSPRPRAATTTAAAATPPTSPTSFYHGEGHSNDPHHGLQTHRRLPRRLTHAHRFGSLYSNTGAMYAAGELPDGTLVGPATARRLSVYQRIGSMRHMPDQVDHEEQHNENVTAAGGGGRGEGGGGGETIAVGSRTRSRTMDASHHYSSSSSSSSDSHDTPAVVIDLSNTANIFAPTNHGTAVPHHRSSHGDNSNALSSAGVEATGETGAAAAGSAGRKQIGRRRMTSSQMRSMSLRSDNGVDTMIDPAALSVNAHTPIGPLQRRMTAHSHRAGSLHSDNGDATAAAMAAAVGGGGGNAFGSGLHQRHYSRIGSMRSDHSDNDNMAHSVAAGGVEEWGCWDFFKNRRFLYLGCLERIMNEEFDFHANEAKRMSVAAGQEDSVGGGLGFGLEDIYNTGEGGLRDSAGSSTTAYSRPSSETADAADAAATAAAAAAQASGDMQRKHEDSSSNNNNNSRRRTSLPPALDMSPIEEDDTQDEDDAELSARVRANDVDSTAASTTAATTSPQLESKECSVDQQGSGGAKGGIRTRRNTDGSGPSLSLSLPADDVEVADDMGGIEMQGHSLLASPSSSSQDQDGSSKSRQRSRAFSSGSGKLTSPSPRHHHGLGNALSNRSHYSNHDSTGGSGGGQQQQQAVIPHQDMLSNFQMMKELRGEMLQSMGGGGADQHHNHHNGHGHHDQPKSFFGSFFFSAQSESHKDDNNNNNTHTPGEGETAVAADAVNNDPLGRRNTIKALAEALDRSEDLDIEAPFTEYADGVGRTYSLQYLEAAQQNAPNPHDMSTTTAAAALNEHRDAHPLSLSSIHSMKDLLLFVWYGVRMLVMSGLSVVLGHHLGLAESDVSPDDDVAMMQKDFSTIFLFNNAEIYYGTVELALLIQCVYLALWVTNFVFVAKESYYPVLWNIALVVPLPINFFILKHVIFSSAMLKSIVTLDKYVSDKICEEAVDVQNVTQRVRKAVRHALRSMEIPKEQWFVFSKDQFLSFIPTGDRGLNIRNFKLFLHSMQIFLTEKSTLRIFTVLDFDRSGKVTWDDIFPVVFPDLQRKQLQVQRKRHSRRSTRHRTVSKDSTTFEEDDDAAGAVREATDTFDANMRGAIKKSPSSQSGRRRESILQQRSSLVLNATIAPQTSAESLVPLDDSTPGSIKARKKKNVNFGVSTSSREDSADNAVASGSTKIATAATTVGASGERGASGKSEATATRKGVSFYCPEADAGAGANDISSSRLNGETEENKDAECEDESTAVIGGGGGAETLGGEDGGEDDAGSDEDEDEDDGDAEDSGEDDVNSASSVSSSDSNN